MNENSVVDQTLVAGTVAGVGDIVKLMSDLSANTSHPFSQTEAHHAVNLMKSAILESLKKGQKVQLTGFVSFVPTYRAARKANNVLTHEPLSVPEGITIVAKAGSVTKAISKEISSEAFQTIKDLALSKKKTPIVQ